MHVWFMYYCAIIRFPMCPKGREIFPGVKGVEAYNIGWMVDYVKVKWRQTATDEVAQLH